MSGYICRTCKLQAASRRAVAASRNRRLFSHHVYRQQESLESIYQGAADEGHSQHGPLQGSKQPVLPTGRYSARALRPQQLLEQLEEPTPISPNNERRPRKAAVPEGADCGPERLGVAPGQSVSLVRFRVTVIRAANAEKKNLLDQEVWPLLLKIINSSDRKYLDSLRRDRNFRLALVRWSARICDDKLDQLSKMLYRRTRTADVASQHIIEPTPLQVVRLCTLFDVDFQVKTAKVLWKMSRGLWESHSVSKNTSSSHDTLDENVMQNIMGLWNIWMSHSLSRFESSERFTFEDALTQMSTPELSWSFLPGRKELKAASLQRSEKSAADSLAQSFSLLFSTYRAPDGHLATAKPLHLPHDLASSALLTLQLLRRSRIDAEEPLYITQSKPWVDLVDSMIRNSTNRQVPPTLAERITNTTEADLAEKYKALVEQMSLTFEASAPSQTDESKTHLAASAASIPIADDNQPVSSDAPSPSGPHKEASRTDKFSYLRIKRLGRASDHQDRHAAERIKQDVEDFNSKHSDLQLPLPLYEHLIMTFLGLRDRRSALESWKSMLVAGHRPTAKTYTIAMRYSLRLKGSEMLHYFWDRMLREGVQPDVHAWTARIYGLFKRDEIGAGMQALTEMGRAWAAAAKAAHAKEEDSRMRSIMRKVTPPDLTTLTARFSGDVGGVPKPTVYTMNSAISGLEKKKHELIPKILAWGRTFGIEPDVVTYNALINVSMRQGDPAQAIELLSRMNHKGIAADGDTWTVLFTAAFQSDAFDGLSPEEQEDKIMQLIGSLEDANAAAIDQKGYAAVLNNLAKQYQNPKAVQSVLTHMVERGVKPTSFHYTILVSHYFDQSPPDLDAVGHLWDSIKDGTTGYGEELTSPFYNRMVEGYAINHRTVGIQPMLSFLSQMEVQGKRPTWRALECVVRALAERNEWDRLSQVANTVRMRMKQEGTGGTTAGQHDFWAFVISTGIYRHEGIVEPNDIMLANTEMDGVYRESTRPPPRRSA